MSKVSAARAAQRKEDVEEKMSEEQVGAALAVPITPLPDLDFDDDLEEATIEVQVVPPEPKPRTASQAVEMSALAGLEAILERVERDGRAREVRVRANPLLIAALAVETRGRTWFRHEHHGLHADLISVMGLPLDRYYAAW